MKLTGYSKNEIFYKPYSKHMDLLYRQWNNKRHPIVNVINLETFVWTDNEE